MKSDKIIKFLAYEGKISFICADTTNLVEKARKIHKLSPVVTAALGRLLTITCIMSCSIKSDKEKITIQLKGNGPIGSLVTVAHSIGKVKGYVDNPWIDLPIREDGKLDVGTAVGKQGYLNIIKDMGLKEPYRGMVPLVSGEIAEDFAQYFAESEQTGTAIALGVLVNPHEVKKAGGYLLTVMPDAKEEIITKIEERLKNMEPVSQMLNSQMTLEEIARKVTGDDQIEIIEEKILPQYICDCSKEKLERVLQFVGKEEIENMIEQDKGAEMICHFCNKKYHFSEPELVKLL